MIRMERKFLHLLIISLECCFCSFAQDSEEMISDMFNYTLNVQNNAPFDVEVFVTRNNKTQIISTIPIREMQNLPSALNTDVYTFKSKNGTSLVVSTIDDNRYAKEFSEKVFKPQDGSVFSLFVSQESFWGRWLSWSSCSKSCFPGGLQNRKRICNTFPRYQNDGIGCVGKDDQTRNCNNVSCSACLFNATGSPGNKIGNRYEYHENVTNVSECQWKCKNYHNSTINHKSDHTCHYFTFYDTKCILKTAKAKWNLLYKPGSITGTRECDLDYLNATATYFHTPTTGEAEVVIRSIFDGNIEDNDVQSHTMMLYAVIGALVLLICLILVTSISIISYYKGKLGKLSISKEQEKSSVSIKCLPITMIVAGNTPIPTQDEFEHLLKYDNKLEQRLTVSQGQRYNKVGGFNQVQNNLPFDHNRIRLKPPIDGCDYINADWLSTASDPSPYDELIYTSYLPFDRVKFAVGQEPLPITKNHHFSMLHQYRFDIAVGFTAEAKTDPPQAGNEYNFPNVTLKVLERVRVGENLARTKIILCNTSGSGLKYEHQLAYFEFENWKTDSITFEETHALVTSMCLIRNEMNQQNSSQNILVHDMKGGVAAAAFFVSMYKFFQQIDESFNEDGCLKQNIDDIDIFSTVNQLRKDREKMIEDYSTYKLLFHCLGYYGSNRKQVLRAVHECEAKLFSDSSRRKETVADGTPYENLGLPQPDISSPEIEYVMHQDSEEEETILFEDYYTDERTLNSKYQNV